MEERLPDDRLIMRVGEVMNLDEVYDLMNEFEQSKLSELNLEMSGVKIGLKKSNGVEPSVAEDRQEYGREHRSGNVRNPKRKQDFETTQSKNGLENSETQENIYEVKSKVAGTFYRAESPDSEPFIQVGDHVKKGDILGMIEAMKIMNQIPSPVDGEVVRINVVNEELVGFDDVMVQIKVK